MKENKVSTDTAAYRFCAPFGFQIALLITLPFWLDRFNTTGSSFDNGFLERTTLLHGRLPHIDYDTTVVGRVWKTAAQRGLNVLPLVQNLSPPSPATGWRYREFPSFLDRARGQFDVVMMLAVVHHLLVTDRVPIDDVFDLIADITTDYLIIEYVGPSDPMFQSIARGRDYLFSWYNQTTFEAAATKHFKILDTEPLTGLDRTLYMLRRHDQNQ